MKSLHIADDLNLPIDVVTEKLAFLGRTGSGKTYAAMKLAELMLEAGAQIVSLDPVGAWHGLRIGGSWTVYIFGGMRGDFPLGPTGGKLMADVVADRGISAVLDISQFLRAEQVRFASDFVERFFQRKKAAPSAVHLFLEECQEFVPQNPGNKEAHMLHHFERAWKLGRNFGIGGSLISQRPQEINKKALNQAGTLFVFNMTGPQERRAIADWTRQAGIDEDIESVLPTLKTGQPHVWSPTFLSTSATVQILPKVTADVSMTPKVGGRTKEQPLTPIDVQKLTAEMAATIEKSKAEDPKELRKQIVALKQEIASMQKAKPEVAKVERVEVSVLTDEDRKLLLASKTVFDQALGVVQFVESHSKKLQLLYERLGKANPPETRLKPGSLNTTSLTSSKKPERLYTDIHSRSRENGNAELGNSGLRRILIALAQYPQGRSSRQVGILAGLSSKSGSFNTYLSKGRSSGWIDGERSLLRITDAGLAVLGEFDPLPQGQELLDYWIAELGDSGAARILRVLAKHYPRALSKEAVGEAAELSHSSGSFNTYLSKLRTLELVEGRGELKASDTLFE